MWLGQANAAPDSLAVCPARLASRPRQWRRKSSAVIVYFRETVLRTRLSSRSLASHLPHSAPTRQRPVRCSSRGYVTPFAVVTAGMSVSRKTSMATFSTVQWPASGETVEGVQPREANGCRSCRSDSRAHNAGVERSNRWPRSMPAAARSSRTRLSRGASAKMRAAAPDELRDPAARRVALRLEPAATDSYLSPCASALPLLGSSRR